MLLVYSQNNGWMTFKKRTKDNTASGIDIVNLLFAFNKTWPHHQKKQIKTIMHAQTMLKVIPSLVIAICSSFKKINMLWYLHIKIIWLILCQKTTSGSSSSINQTWAFWLEEQSIGVCIKNQLMGAAAQTKHYISAFCLYPTSLTTLLKLMKANKFRVCQALIESVAFYQYLQQSLISWMGRNALTL